MIVYTPQIRAAVKSIRVPNDFKVDFVEYALPPPFIALRFYESQWAHYSERERLQCTSYLDKVKRTIESFGVRVTLEPVLDTR